MMYICAITLSRSKYAPILGLSGLKWAIAVVAGPIVPQALLPSTGCICKILIGLDGGQHKPHVVLADMLQEVFAVFHRQQPQESQGEWISRRKQEKPTMTAEFGCGIRSRVSSSRPVRSVV
jgi:hypothetical protein